MAEEVATRTVNKRRRMDGRMPNKRTQSTGNPNTPIPDRTRDELYNVAKEMGIIGRGHMSKAELVKEISRRQS